MGASRSSRSPPPWLHSPGPRQPLVHRGPRRARWPAHAERARYVLSHPQRAGDITPGSDGNLWFTFLERGIGRITPAGVGHRVGRRRRITKNGVDQKRSGPTAISGSPRKRAARVGTRRPVWSRSSSSPPRRFAPPASRPAPTATSGSPNGRSAGWDASRPAGVITEFPPPARRAVRHSITAGPDGNLWFTEPDVTRSRVSPLPGRWSSSQRRA